VIRPPPISLGVCGTVLSVTGYTIMPFVGGKPMVTLAALAVGIGQACFLAAVIPTLNSLIDESERRQVFARRYQVLNGTAALGVLTAGTMTAVLSREVLTYLFALTAIGYLPITVVQLTIKKFVNSHSGTAALEQRKDNAESLSVSALFKSCTFISLFQFGVFLMGFSQFESTTPLAADKLLGTSLAWIAVTLGVNTAVIILAQHHMTKLLEKRDSIFGLRTALGFWVAGYLIVALPALGPRELAITGLLLYAALFGLGECAYSCTYHPWLISTVPAPDLTRANVLANSVMGIGLLAGPTLGVALVATGSATIVWLTLSAVTLLVVLTTARTKQLVGSTS
jgi:hypothetical protein